MGVRLGAYVSGLRILLILMRNTVQKYIITIIIEYQIYIPFLFGTGYPATYTAIVHANRHVLGTDGP